MKLAWGQIKRLILDEGPGPGRRNIPSGQARHLSDQTRVFKDAVPGTGRYLGSGEQGDVFEFTGGNLIKVVPEWQCGDGTVPEAIKQQLAHPNEHIVTVLNAGVANLNPDWGRAYWYVMERLQPLSIEDAHIIDDANERWVINRDTSIPSDVNPKLTELINFAIKSGHNDWNSDNVMQDASGNYKLIDLESF